LQNKKYTHIKIIAYKNKNLQTDFLNKENRPDKATFLDMQIIPTFEQVIEVHDSDSENEYEEYTDHVHDDPEIVEVDDSEDELDKLIEEKEKELEEAKLEHEEKYGEIEESEPEIEEDDEQEHDEVEHPEQWKNWEKAHYPSQITYGAFVILHQQYYSSPEYSYLYTDRSEKRKREDEDETDLPSRKKY